MNKIEVDGCIVKGPHRLYRNNAGRCKLALRHLSECRSTDLPYTHFRDDTFTVVVNADLAEKVLNKLHRLDNISVNGTLRNVNNKICIIAESIKVNTKGYYRDIVTGKF